MHSSSVDVQLQYIRKCWIWCLLWYVKHTHSYSVHASHRKYWSRICLGILLAVHHMRSYSWSLRQQSKDHLSTEDDHQEDQDVSGSERSRMSWNRISILSWPGGRQLIDIIGIQLRTQLYWRFQYGMKKKKTKDWNIITYAICIKTMRRLTFWSQMLPYRCCKATCARPG